MQYMITAFAIWSSTLKRLEVLNDNLRIKKSLENYWCPMLTKMTCTPSVTCPWVQWPQFTERVIFEPVISEAVAHKHDKYFWNNNILWGKHMTGIQNSQFYTEFSNLLSDHLFFLCNKESHFCLYYCYLGEACQDRVRIRSNSKSS